MTGTRILVAEKHEIHMIEALDTAWHQLDRLCPCGPDIFPFGSPVNLWVRMEHLHYGPQEEFGSETPS